MHYHDSDDLKRLGEFKQLAPREFSTFVEFDKTVGREDGTIPRKYRELIAIAVACTTQCPYCLDVHTRAAKRTCTPTSSPVIMSSRNVLERAFISGKAPAQRSLTKRSRTVIPFNSVTAGSIFLRLPDTPWRAFASR